jgi:hypothetical protein
MNRTPLHWLRHSVVFALASVAAGCADQAPTGPEQTASFPSQLAAPGSRKADVLVDLAGCDSLRAPAGSTLVFGAYATGVQIYRWTGTSWMFVEPSATLFADAGGSGVVATHYAGPTWESVSGGKVVGSAPKRCTPDATAIPWLLLSATPDGAGVFQHVKYIQRLNTVGGLAPSTAGSFTGEVRKVPYTAVYLFYNA